MAYTLIQSVSAASGGGGTVTTGAIDTTGANLIVIALGSFEPSTAEDPTAVPTDSKSNVYTALTRQELSVSVSTQLFYVLNPTVGSGHTFTFARTNAFPAIAVYAFSGAAVASVFDQQSGATGSAGTSLQPGSVTPSQDNELVVTGLAFGSAGTGQSINSGFSTPITVAYGSGTNFGVSIAYLIQGSAAAVNPTWSWSNADDGATAIATFKAAAGSAITRDPGVGSVPVTGLTMGMGFGIDMPSQAMGIAGKLIELVEIRNTGQILIAPV